MKRDRIENGSSPARGLAVLAALVLLLGGSALPRAQASPAATRFVPTNASMVPTNPMQAKECAFIYENGVFHLFWMRTDPTVPYDSTERDMGHAVSTDLRNWTQLDSVMPARPDKWDNLHIWAPTIIKKDGVYYMYYTGVTNVPYAWNLYQRIGLATSTDLLNWTRTDEPVMSAAIMPWAFSDSSVFEGCQFRDPYAIPDPNTPGRTLIYYVTTPDSARSQLIVGVAQTTDMFTVTDLMPLWCTDDAHFWGWCESPHVIEHNGLWYLFATTSSGHPIGFRTAASPIADSLDWSGKYRLYDMTGQDDLSDFWFGSETFSIPGHDYFAVINSTGYRVDIYEILWDETPPGFQIVSPGVASAVPPAALPTHVSLTALPRSGTGQGVMFTARLPEAGDARVDLYDVSGRRVRTLHSGALPAGESVVAWDGRLAGGEGASAGVYFAALTANAARSVARVSITH